VTATSASDAPASKVVSAAGIGILGGTFNPPHRGHVALARHARAELGLERVLLIPANSPPHKPARREDPGPEHRLEMCRLAVSAIAGLSASGIEIERGGASYTVDTLEAIHDQCPEAELTFIVGADIARTLPSWREPARLLELARLAVAERAGLDDRDAREALRASAARLRSVGGSEQRVTFLTMGEIAVSSSLVRERVAAGAPIAELVGEPVASYIAEHGLYRAAIAVAEIGGGG
jgi:nicotinate-nucleotide adenylyltransferase